jgi:hypothetical protein
LKERGRLRESLRKEMEKERKKEREKKREKKAQEQAQKKQQKVREEQAAESRKIVQPSQLAQATTSKKQAPKMKRVKRCTSSVSRVVGEEPLLTPPRKVTRRGRNITVPRNFK